MEITSLLVSDDGNIYALCYMKESDKTTCNHKYSVHLEITEHKKNSNGGCITISMMDLNVQNVMI